jgi:hypothetical protein
MEAGGKISFRGLLTSEQTGVAEVERTIWLACSFAQHHGFTVFPRSAGKDRTAAESSKVERVEIVSVLTQEVRPRD